MDWLRRYKIVFAVSLLLAIVLGLSIYWFNRKKTTLVNPKVGPLIESIYGLGKVKTKRRYEVKLGVTATVTQLFVNEGDVVREGQSLIKFDTLANFRAPFAGVVTLVNAYENETAMPQTVVLRLEDLGDRYIEVSLEQEAALRVKAKQNVKVVFESIRNKIYFGTVDSVFPKNEEFLAHINVGGLDQNILPGMTADTSIEIGRIEQATLVPLAGVRNGMVVLKRAGRQKKVKVEIDHVDGLWAELKSGDIQMSDEILVPEIKP